MNTKDLRAQQLAILNRFSELDSTKKFKQYNFFGSGVYISDTAACFMDNGRIESHEDIGKLLNSLNNFYNNTSPSEIEFLNTPLKQCAHCKSYYVLNDFPEVKNPLQTLSFQPFFEGGEQRHIYCDSCIYEVPWVTFGEDRPGEVYLMKWGEYTKIGRSKNTLKRKTELNKTFPGIELIAYLPVRDMYVAEAHLHTIFCHKHVRNELFELDALDLDYIQHEILFVEEN